MPSGATILPLPMSGRAAREHEAALKSAKAKSGCATVGGGSPTAAAGGAAAGDKPRADFSAILDLHHKQPPPCTYDLPSAFDPVFSRSPRVTVPKAPKTSRYMADVDLFKASKGPGPGQYSRHLDRSGFAGRDRSRRPKLAIERLNAHAVALPPIGWRRPDGGAVTARHYADHDSTM